MYNAVVDYGRDFKAMQEAYERRHPGLKSRYRPAVNHYRKYYGANSDVALLRTPQQIAEDFKRLGVKDSFLVEHSVNGGDYRRIHQMFIDHHLPSQMPPRSRLSLTPNLFQKTLLKGRWSHSLVSLYPPMMPGCELRWWHHFADTDALMLSKIMGVVFRHTVYRDQENMPSTLRPSPMTASDQLLQPNPDQLTNISTPVADWYAKKKNGKEETQDSQRGM